MDELTEEEVQQLVDDLSRMVDEWQETAKERRDVIIKLVIALLALEDDPFSAFRRRDWASLFGEAYRRAGVPEVDLQRRVDRIRETYPDATLPVEKAELLREKTRTALDRIGQGVEARIQQSRLSDAPADDTVQAVGEQLEKDINRVTTELSETQTQTDRVVLESMGAEYYRYMGPVDEKNRPFCADVASRFEVFTPEGIEVLNNHPDLEPYVPPSVAVLCGGFNCRHVWAPVPSVPEGWGVNDGSA